MEKKEVERVLKQIVEIAENHNNGYHYKMVVTEWANYGKSRTYYSIVETRENSKHYAVKKYGFYDNQAEVMVSSKDDAKLCYAFDGSKLN